MTPKAAVASYRRAMDRSGQPIILRRYTGAGQNRPRHDVEVRARVVDYSPEELVGGIVMGDRKVILLAEDLIAAQFAMPRSPSSNLKCVVRGREFGIKAIDDETRRIGTTLIAYELQIGGA